jgi:hypothetical protein
MMTASSDHIKLKTQIKAFVSRPGIHRNLDTLRHCLPKSASILVVGGAIRNLLIEHIHGSAPQTDDIDLFVDGVPGEYPLENRLAGQNFHRTELDGLRWRPAKSNYAYDICLLPNFVVVAKYRLTPTVQNLLASIDFTVNAIGYDIDRHILHEHGCISAIKNRLIEFNTRRMVNKLLLAYRILLIHHKTGFQLSTEVQSFLKSQIDFDTLGRLKDLLKAKQGANAAKIILKDYDR